MFEKTFHFRDFHHLYVHHESLTRSILLHVDPHHTNFKGLYETDTGVTFYFNDSLSTAEESTLRQLIDNYDGQSSDIIPSTIPYDEHILQSDIHVPHSTIHVVGEKGLTNKEDHTTIDDNITLQLAIQNLPLIPSFDQRDQIYLPVVQESVVVNHETIIHHHEKIPLSNFVLAQDFNIRSDERIELQKNKQLGLAALNEFGKIDAHLLSLPSNLTLLGGWNAATNNPLLQSSWGEPSTYFIVTVDGSTNINDINHWEKGDWIVFSVDKWEKIQDVQRVKSVAGKIGPIELAGEDLTYGTINPARIPLVAITQYEQQMSIRNLGGFNSSSFIDHSNIHINGEEGIVGSGDLTKDLTLTLGIQHLREPTTIELDTILLIHDGNSHKQLKIKNLPVQLCNNFNSEVQKVIDNQKTIPYGLATLNAEGKIPSNQLMLPSTLQFKGVIDLNDTTTLDLRNNNLKIDGNYYIVSVGSTSLKLNDDDEELITYEKNDWIVYCSPHWIKLDNTDNVKSVAGKSGHVELEAKDILRGTFEKERINFESIEQHLPQCHISDMKDYILEQHIDHSNVYIRTELGLKGGGNIISSNTIGLAISHLPLSSPISATDQDTLLCYNVTNKRHEQLSLEHLPIQDHSTDKISNFTEAVHALIEEQRGNTIASLKNGKIPASELTLPSSLIYVGSWNAMLNDDPHLISGQGIQGHYYIVNTSGTTKLDNIEEWYTNDWVVFNGFIWEKIDNHQTITKVAGKIGDVVLDGSDIISGVLANERITVSSIEQHQNKLDIKEFKGFVTSNYLNHDDIYIHTSNGLKGGSSINNSQTLQLALNDLGEKVHPSGDDSSVLVNEQGLHFSMKLKHLPIPNYFKVEVENMIEHKRGTTLASLNENGKIPASQLSLPSSLLYQGTWNASLNIPPLTSTIGTQGYYYTINVGGNTLIDDINDWQPKDCIVFNGLVWEKIDNSEQVISVAGRKGDIIIQAEDIHSGIFKDELISSSSILQHITSLPITNLQGYVPHEHIDHSNVSILTDTGLQGGGDLTASRNISLAIQHLSSHEHTTLQDKILIYDVIEQKHKHSSLNDLVVDAEHIVTGIIPIDRISSASIVQHIGSLDMKDLKNYIVNEHIDHSTVHIVAGSGLCGGGNILNDRMLELDVSNLLYYSIPQLNTDAVAIYDFNEGKTKKCLLKNLPVPYHSADLLSSGYIQDGRLSSSSVLQFENLLNMRNLKNYNMNEHIDHTTISINGIHGLQGGGDLTSSRQLSLDINSLPVTTTPSLNDVVLLYDVTNNIHKKAIVNHLPIPNHSATSITSGYLNDARITASSILQHISSLPLTGLQGYNIDQHIDHSTVSIVGSAGISGGGNLTMSRNLSLDIMGLPPYSNPMINNDYGIIYDTTTSNHKKIMLNKWPVNVHSASLITSGSLADTCINASSIIQHASSIPLSSLHGYVLQQHIDHSNISIIGSEGIIGGGDLTSSRTLSLNIPSLTEALPSLSDDYCLFYDVSTSSHKKALLNTFPVPHHSANIITSGYINDERITLSSIIQHASSLPLSSLQGYTINQHIDHSTIRIDGIDGISGGGDMTSSRTLSLNIKGLNTTTLPLDTDYTIIYDMISNTHKKTCIQDLPVPLHSSSKITDLNNVVQNIITTQKGISNGLASLNNDGKIPSSQLTLPSSLTYQGTWNASTNSPNLFTTINNKGDYYTVSVGGSGSVLINNITDWQPKDWIIFNGMEWEKLDTTDQVTTVAGRQGDILLTTDDIIGGVFNNERISSSSIVQHSSSIPLMNLFGYESNQHVDHSNIYIHTDEGIGGGGDMMMSRTLKLDIPNLSTCSSPPTSNDFTIIYDTITSTHKKITLNSLPVPNHSATLLTSGYVGDERISSSSIVQHVSTIPLIQLQGYDPHKFMDHSTLYVYTQEGISGGGDMTSSRTLKLNINGLNQYNPIATDYTLIYDVNTSTHKKVLLHTLPTNAHSAHLITSDFIADERISSSSIVQHSSMIDIMNLNGYVSTEHIDHSTLYVYTQEGISGGGDLTNSLTLSLDITNLLTYDTPLIHDYMLVYNVVDGTHRKCSMNTLLLNATNLSTGTVPDNRISSSSIVQHANNIPLENLQGYITNEHINHSNIYILSSEGIRGGGDMTSSRTLRLDVSNLNTSIPSLNDYCLIYDVGEQQHKKSLIHNLPVPSHLSTQISDFSTAVDERLILQKGLANGIASLDPSGKIPASQLTLPSSLYYQGTWNALNNIPFLNNGQGTMGYYYTVSIGGTTLIDNIQDWQPKDWIVFNGTVWEKIDNTDLVSSVAGRIGDISLDASDIWSGTFSDNRISSSSILQHQNLFHIPSLGGYVVNQHIDHSSISIVADEGLSGGGDWTTSRTVRLAIHNLTNYTPSSNDYTLVYDVNTSTHKKTYLSSLPVPAHSASLLTSGTIPDSRLAATAITQHTSSIDLTSLSGYVANQHIDHSTISILAGIGLSGGGSMTTSRTLNIDMTGLTTYIPTSNDYSMIYDVNTSTHKKSLLVNIPVPAHSASLLTSGTIHDSRIAATSIIQHTSSIALTGLSGYVANQHIDHSTISILPGIGLSGGGSMTTSRTLNIDMTGLIAYTPTSTDYALIYDVTSSAHKKALISTLNMGAIGAQKGYIQYRANQAGNFDSTSQFMWNNVKNSLQIGSGGGTGLNGNPIDVSDTNTSWLQTNLQNKSNAIGASSDMVLTCDTGNDNQGYIDVGINSSGYGASTYTCTGPTDGYLAINGGNLTLVTETNDDIVVVTGGTMASNIRGKITSTGNWVIGNSALSTSSTNGFLYLPSTAGQPTGQPTSYNGMIPMIMDSTNNKFYFYSNGAWKTINTLLEVTANTNTSTTSTTYAAMTGMTMIPPAGTYKVSFTSSCSCSIVNTACQVAIYKNGTIVDHSQIEINVAATTERLPIHSQAKVLCNGTDTVSIYYHSTSSATLTCYNRNFELLLCS